MASKRPLRSILISASPAIRQSQPLRRPFPETSACAFSTSNPSRSAEFDFEPSTQTSTRPRWQQTPARMVAPVRIRPLPKGPAFVVNEDPRRLNEVYVRMLGQGGDKVLSDEVKWLAVTHKSFDHGRRGHNDRLAFLGRRIVSLQTSLALINSPQATKAKKDRFGRKPYEHSALDGLPGLSFEAKGNTLDIARLAPIAERYGLDKVTRWKPRLTDNLEASGQPAVLTTSLYAIIGALALERGGEVANKVVQNRILSPLGFSFAEEPDTNTL